MVLFQSRFIANRKFRSAHAQRPVHPWPFLPAAPFRPLARNRLARRQRRAGARLERAHHQGVLRPPGLGPQAGRPGPHPRAGELLRLDELQLRPDPAALDGAARAADLCARSRRGQVEPRSTGTRQRPGPSVPSRHHAPGHGFGQGPGSGLGRPGFPDTLRPRPRGHVAGRDGRGPADPFGPGQGRHRLHHPRPAPGQGRARRRRGVQDRDRGQPRHYAALSGQAPGRQEHKCVFLRRRRVAGRGFRAPAGQRREFLDPPHGLPAGWSAAHRHGRGILRAPLHVRRDGPGLRHRAGPPGPR
ncbi:hypothetical protein DSECCO2_401770 [anaerobic digester metagenome]